MVEGEVGENQNKAKKLNPLHECVTKMALLMITKGSECLQLK